jgi:molybdopterin/thiamine biosynthesis adenylyltransferase
MVIAQEGARARHLAGRREIPIWSVGADLLQIADASSDVAAAAERYDRQIRAFGAAGQRAVSMLTVCVIGVGGTGSVLVQQLAHLGVSDFVLMDPDRIEATNLNRVVGSTPSDVGRPKVEVARNMILATNPLATVRAEIRDVLDANPALIVAGSDFAFSCTDSHASRALVCQVAYQHHVPVIDIGVAIGTDSGRISHVTGRVQMLAPGLPCLLCTGALDGDRIRIELMNSDQRAADPYFEGDGEPQPAVISLNSTMSSLAATMFLAAVAGVPSAARHQSYDARSGAVRPVAATARDGCPICSMRGALSKGAAWPLPTRPIG